MKKALKLIGKILGVIILLLLIVAAYIQFSPIPTYEAKAPQLTVTPDSALIAEGRRLAGMVCNQCHMADNGKLEGKLMADLPKAFGKAWTGNITNDPKYGAGRYSDGELAYFLRTGIKRDGKYAPPWMPKFPHLSDQDLHSVIAYLRSDAPEVQASDKQHPAAQPSFLTKLLCRVAFKPLPYPDKPITAPPIEDKVAYGRYLVTGKVECYSCHSENFATMNMMEPEKTPGYFAGGNPIPNLEGVIINSANLTKDPETGIGSWTEEQFIQTVKFGKRPDGKPIRYPMVPFGGLSDEEVSTIWAYLQSLPAVHHPVDRKW